MTDRPTYQWQRFGSVYQAYSLDNRLLVWKIRDRTPGWLLTHVDTHALDIQLYKIKKEDPDIYLRDEMRRLLADAKQEGPFLTFKEAKAVGEAFIDKLYGTGRGEESS